MPEVAAQPLLPATPDDAAVALRDAAGAVRLCGEVPGPYRQHPLEAAGLAERF